jgi:hypothetical protein
MARGEESLRLELARRAAAKQQPVEERRPNIPIPPPPGPPGPRDYLLPGLLIAGVLLLVGRGLRRYFT